MKKIRISSLILIIVLICNLGIHPSYALSQLPGVASYKYIVDNENELIKGISFGVDCNEMLANLRCSDGNVAIYNRSGYIKQSGYVRNGDKLRYTTSNGLREYTLMVDSGHKLQFQDANIGVPVSYLSDLYFSEYEPRKLRLSIEIDNHSGTTKPYMFSLALYENNKMKKIENISKELKSQEDIYEFLLDIDIPEGDNYSVKAFAWETGNNMTPYTQKIEIGSNKRSVLYPEDWTPGYKVGDMFLHDFSYAGYKKGEESIPDITLPIITPDPKLVDPTGVNDSTAGIQAAIDAAGNLPGGGVVQLGKGTYRIKKTGQSYCLWMRKSNVVLRGAGVNDTFIYNSDTENMRTSRIIFVGPLKNSWDEAISTPLYLSQDVKEQMQTIPLTSTYGLAVNDWVVIAADVTDGITMGDPSNNFVNEHDMDGEWNSTDAGPRFYRQITSITSNSITVDIPLRYWLKTRDNARVYKVNPHIENVGIEDLSIGNLENKKDGWGDYDFSVEGTGAYDVHASKVIDVLHVVNGWIRRVNTYKPEGNVSAHVLSKIINVARSRNITVADCVLSHSQYNGGGGNGYGITISGNDCLFTNNYIYKTRHSFSFGGMGGSGNVLYKNITEDSRLTMDFHQKLSMSNLIDSTTLKYDSLAAAIRDGATSETDHGQTTTQSVIWNTNSMRHKIYDSMNYSIQSTQYGNGYIIGTKGATAYDLITTPVVQESNGKSTAPKDWSEFIGKGDVLEPQSLYADQLLKRTGKLPYPTISRFVFLEDAIASQSSPTSKNNTDRLAVKGGQDNKEAYLKINLGAMNADFKKVTLRVYVKQSPISDANIKVYGSTQSNWNESELNWNNRPSAVQEVGSTIISPNSTGKSFNIDISDYINSVKLENASKASYAQEAMYITLRIVNLSGEEILFHSTEPQSGFEAYRPNLIVEF